MTPIRTLTVPFAIQDPNGSSPRSTFASNIAYCVELDESAGVFRITGTQTQVTVYYSGPASWVVQGPAGFPTKAALLEKIDALESRTLGTRRGKKV